MNIKYFKDIVAPKIQKTIESNLLEKSAKKSVVPNALDSILQTDLTEHALPEGFTPQLQEILKLGRKEFLTMLLNPELKNPDFVSNLMDKYDQVFGDASYDALYYVTAQPRDKVLRILDAKELSSIPDAAVRNSKAAEVLNATDFKKISSQSVKNLNPDSIVTIFKKPVTIDQLKSDVYKRYAEEFKKLTGVELTKSEVIDLATETPRFKEIEKLENEMLNMDSKHYTIYGAVSNGGAEDLSGFILGNTSIDKNDPAIKLMHQLINNLKGTTLSGRDLNKLEDKVLNTIPKNRTYLYSSDSQKSIIGGYFTTDTGLSFVNTRVSDPDQARSTLIHEGLSHATDGVLPKKIKLTYQDLISAFNLTPKTPESSNWEELRATLTELKNKLAPDGSIKTLQEKVAQMNSEELASHLHEINAYGRDYADNLRSSTSPELKANTIKNAIVTLPVGLLAVLFGTQAIENSDITSAKNGGIIKAQDGTKFLVIKDEPEFDYEEPEFNFRHLNDELEALDLDNYLTDLYYQKRIKYGLPDKDAIQEIQRHYNLSKDLILETFDDLYNYGLGRVLTADLEDHPIEDVIPDEHQIDDETVVLKNGGAIPKYSIGAAIKKFIGSELSNLAPEIGTKAIGDAASEAIEKKLFLSYSSLQEQVQS